MPHDNFIGFDIVNDVFNLGSVRFETERRLKNGSETEYQQRTITYISAWLDRDSASVDLASISSLTDPVFNVGNSVIGEITEKEFGGFFNVDSYAVDYMAEKATITISARSVPTGWVDEVTF